MKKLLIGLTLLTSMSVGAETLVSEFVGSYNLESCQGDVVAERVYDNLTIVDVKNFEDFGDYGLKGIVEVSWDETDI